MIRDAAGGDVDARQLFAERYEHIVRAYLLSRWRSSPMLNELDDVIQEVFVESFRDGPRLLDHNPDEAAPCQICCWQRFDDSQRKG